MCGNCVYWLAMAERVKPIIDGVHATSRIGICTNPIVRDSVFSTQLSGEIVLLDNNVEFDEQFSCAFEKSNIS